MLRKCWTLVVGLVILAACTTADGSLPTTPATTPPENTPFTEVSPTLADEATPPAPTTTITATVMDVFLSARVIMLTQPVQGFEHVALTDDTELVFADGSGATLQDMRPGTAIQASGQAGEAGTLLAERVLILPDATPAD